jgi:hypothetical protein
MTKTGLRPSTTNTFPSDAGNATSMVTSSENALSISSTKKESQKQARTRTQKDLCSKQAKDGREKGSTLLR